MKKRLFLSFISAFLAAVMCCNVFAASSKAASTKAAASFYVADGYDYSKPVPLSAAVSNTFFDKAAFLGDSRGVDLILYSDINKTKALPYCEVGLNVSTALTKDFVNIKGKSYTALEALKKNIKNIDKVYLIFGLNELGYPTPEGFVKQYEKLISAIRKLKPQLAIYVTSILPVSRQKDGSDKTVTLKNICVMNEAIKQMCQARKLFFVDAYDAFTDGEGYLPYGVASDGVHFSSAICNSWFGFFKTHTVKGETKK